MKFYLKLKYFYSRKCVWTCRLRNGGHFVPGEISYFPKFNWANVEVWEWIRNFIPHLKRCDYESILRFQLIYVSKGTTGAPARILATGREIPNQYGKDVWYKTTTKIRHCLESSVFISKNFSAIISPCVTWDFRHGTSDFVAAGEGAVETTKT